MLLPKVRLEKDLEPERDRPSTSKAPQATMEEEEAQKSHTRLVVCTLGITVFCIVLCFGLRQLALLEDRVQQRHLYNQLEQELVELADESLDEFEEDSIS